jgi:hypothetical protein
MDRIEVKLIGPDFKCTMSVLKKTRIFEIRSKLRHLFSISLFTLKFRHQGKILSLEDKIENMNILHISIEGDTLIASYKDYYIGESQWNSERLLNIEAKKYEETNNDKLTKKESIFHLESCIEVLDLMNIGKCGIMRKELISFFSDKKKHGKFRFHGVMNSSPEEFSDFFIFVWFSTIAVLKTFNYKFDNKDGFINYDAKFLHDQISESKNRYKC